MQLRNNNFSLFLVSLVCGIVADLFQPKTYTGKRPVWILGLRVTEMDSKIPRNCQSLVSFTASVTCKGVFPHYRKQNEMQIKEQFNLWSCRSDCSFCKYVFVGGY